MTQTELYNGLFIYEFYNYEQSNSSLKSNV